MDLKNFVFILVFTLAGCASYTTPGGSVRLSTLADDNINEIMQQEPAAVFPANIALARVQASGYRSNSLNSFGTGRYSVVTTREAETEEDFERLLKQPEIAGVAPLNRILLPPQLNSVKSLREASAQLRADVLLIYSFDTSFHAGRQKFAPLNVVSLGFLKNKKVSVTTTVSAAFFDVRTGFLYGLSEATAKDSKHSTVWSKAASVDDMRVVTEKAAFQKLIPELEDTWAGIVSEHANKPDTVSLLR